ncbi:MAG: pseudouridine synthase [Bacteroidia bacterium]|nr:pseudouridine synthase [Bacteroidia bacterium]
MESEELEILYLDEHIVAVNKPAGMIVHRNEYTQEEFENLLNLLSRQLKAYLYPVHRLDRATAGVMVFALSKEVSNGLMKGFSEKKISKEYLCIVRGLAEEQAIITRELRKKPTNKFQKAETHFWTLAQKELPISLGEFPTVRYSLLRVLPLTGRRHQIRRHLSYEHHPILGDKKHGHSTHNKLWLEELKLPGLMLQAHKLAFEHPINGEKIKLQASIAPHIQDAIQYMGWESP